MGVADPEQGSQGDDHAGERHEQPAQPVGGEQERLQRRGQGQRDRDLQAGHRDAEQGDRAGDGRRDSGGHDHGAGEQVPQPGRRDERPRRWRARTSRSWVGSPAVATSVPKSSTSPTGHRPQGGDDGLRRRRAAGHVDVHLDEVGDGTGDGVGAGELAAAAGAVTDRDDHPRVRGGRRRC